MSLCVWLFLCLICVMFRSLYVVCFRQKTAYELRISDWSSDVCSSDLIGQFLDENRALILQTFDHEAIVNDLVPYINRRAIAFQRQFDDADRTVDTGAKPARRRDQQVDPGAYGRSFSLCHRQRSEERRVGKECVSPCRFRCSTAHKKNKNQQ